MDAEAARTNTPSGMSWFTRSLASIGVVVVVVSVLEYQPATTVTVGVVKVDPLPAVAALAGLVFGPVVVLASAIGYLAFLGAYAHLAPIAVWNAAGYLVLGWLSYALWGSLGRYSSGLDLRVPTRATIGEFVAIAILSALGASAVVSWGHDIAGYAAFYPRSLIYFASSCVSIIAFGIAILTPWWLVSHEEVPLRDPRPSRYEPIRNMSTGSAGVPIMSILLPIFWLLAGNAVSVGYNLIGRIPSSVFRDLGVEGITALQGTGVLGRGGMVVQTTLGTVVLVLWIASLRREVLK